VWVSSCLLCANTLEMPRSARLSIPTRERKVLDASLYSSIDSFLKPLKATTRRLQVASTTMANEEQLLQRIYYKGKNQHRSALFWRRTAEIRRYAQRTKDLNLADLLHRLRCSFFGEEALSKSVSLVALLPQEVLKADWGLPVNPYSRVHGIAVLNLKLWMRCFHAS
jgi:hypothetical protein